MIPGRSPRTPAARRGTRAVRAALAAVAAVTLVGAAEAEVLCGRDPLGGDHVLFRRSPGISLYQTVRVPVGTRVKLLEARGDWRRVRKATSLGTLSGWVFARNVCDDPAPTAKRGR